VDPTTANTMFATALVLSMPLFIFFGALSDKIGRKPIIMIGILLAALSYGPVFKALTQAANPGAGAGPGQRLDRADRRPARMLVPGQPGRAR
jgi:MFS family permease